MFLRKLLGSNNDKKKDSDPAPPAGVQAMGVTLQRKFAKGVQYNMKIIIKGDRNVGKSCLFQRLQGQKFMEEYIPTEEIQVASIQWNYKATDDIVKVEVWDVVDKGKKKKKLEGLKLTAEDDAFEDACLDAEFIDVFKGTHGVIMVMDITKQWTFDYIEREMAKVPAGLPVLVLANHRDMGHHRTVTEDRVRYYIDELDRGADAGPVRYVEASMRNGFGLKYIHKFFNLPFLRLQRETLLKQLETNTREIQLTNDELNVHEESEEQNYDVFLAALTAKRREQAELLAEEALRDTRRQDDITTTKSVPVSPASTPTAAASQQQTAPRTLQLPSGSVSAPVTPATTPQVENKTGSLMSRLFSSKNKSDNNSTPSATAPVEAAKHVGNIDDFHPEEGLDASFLDEVMATSAPAVGTDEGNSSNDEVGNPMVAAFQDDLDSGDELVATVAVEVADISSDEEEVQEMNSLPLQPVVSQEPIRKISAHSMTVDVSYDSSDDDNKPRLNGSAEKHGDTAVYVIDNNEDISDLDESATADNVVEKNKPQPQEMPSALQFEDLSILETGFRKQEQSSEKAERDQDLTRRKKKHRSKDKGEADKSHKKKKKHKEREKEANEDADEEKKKKKKSKRRSEERKKEIDELEAFLGGAVGNEMPTSAGAYESL